MKLYYPREITTIRTKPTENSEYTLQNIYINRILVLPGTKFDTEK